MKADLHCHTTISDGSLGISDIIKQADRNDVRYLAITDHDSLASLSRSAVLGKRYNVTVVPAAEFSAFDSARGRKVHILCYMPEKPDRLEGLCLRTSEGRMKLGKSIALRVLEKYPITLESILRYSAGSKAIYKCHIMHALMDYGYTTELYGSVYDEIFDAKSGLCASQVQQEADFYPDVRFVTTLIKASGGVSVMAHPKVYDSLDLLEELAADGAIDGVEVWHSSADEAFRRQVTELSARYGLITTGGSDFHGFYNHYAIQIGSNPTPEEELEKILNHKVKAL
ncbi:MAG: PHP domain-containing protein [Lachnospiraceae bacterium]|nr:PHP domain-containing protein [Ruminococcus sp.]MCM1275853.1 PHP domain-containing protein [Lachnospiraceae bacterium]